MSLNPDHQLCLARLRGLDATGLVAVNGENDVRRIVAWHGHVEPGGAIPLSDLWVSVAEPATRDRVLRWMGAWIWTGPDLADCPRWERLSIPWTWALWSEGREALFTGIREVGGRHVPLLRHNHDDLLALVLSATAIDAEYDEVPF